jgi:hypothetical protein
MTTKPTDTLTNDFTTAAGSRVIVSSLNLMTRDTRGGLDAAAQADLKVITSAGGKVRTEWAERYVKSAGGSTVTSGAGFSASKPKM